MIKLFFGDGSFELERKLAQTIVDSKANVEYVNCDDLTVNDLSNILNGATLFEDSRLVVIRHLSDNAAVWEALAAVDSVENEVILVESKIDKRSKTYKHLQKTADIQEFSAYSERDAYKVQRWLETEIAAKDLKLNNKVIQHLTEVVGLDQWRLAQALDKLSLLGVEVTAGVIDETIEPSVEQGVFGIFEMAVRGETQSVIDSLARIELTEEPQKLFGLFVSQVFNLAALTFSDKTPANIASELGVHPFAIGGLRKLSDNVSKQKMRKILEMFNQADREIKITNMDAWLVIKSLLVKVSKL